MGQRQHSLILALTLIFTLIGSVQGETQQDVITQTEGLEPHDGIHYFAGTTSTFQISIKNTGLDDETIEINPSCMATFQIINQNSEIVYDLEDHRLCPNQKRGETLTSAEILANISMPSSVNSRLTFSVFNNSLYCLIKLLSGSLRILLKSSSLSAFNSTRIGNLPCNSGNKSEGLAS